MPLSRVRHAVAAAGLFAAAFASALTLDGDFSDVALAGPEVYGPDMRLAPELPEAATLAVLAVAMAAAAFARGRKGVSP